MNNILAVKVLMSHLPDIKDGAYKTATEIAIDVLFKDARNDYYLDGISSDITFQEYLELTNEQYERWVR